MAMIVGSHFASHGGFKFDSHIITIPQLWWSVIRMGGEFGVDVFVIISGYFLIDNASLCINPKKPVKLWGPIFFYSVLLFFVAFLLGKGDASPKSIIKALFPVLSGKWWFASTYFVMYLIHPYMNRMLRSFTKKEYQKYLLFIFFIWSIIPTFTTSSFQLNSLIEFALYYSIAGYIRLYGLRPDMKCKAWFRLWLAFSVLTYLSCVFFMFLGTKYEFFSTRYLYFYNRNSVLTVFRAVSFFMLFLKMNIGNSRFVNKVSSAAFGVYLLHDSPFLRQVFWNDVFHNAQFQNTAYLIPYSIAAILAVYIVCTCVDLVRIKFIEKPFIKLSGKCLEKHRPLFRKYISLAGNVIFGKE